MTPSVPETDSTGRRRGEMFCIFSFIPFLPSFPDLTVSIFLLVERKMTTKIPLESWQQSSDFY